jgi:hypothetical protein
VSGMVFRRRSTFAVTLLACCACVCASWTVHAPLRATSSASCVHSAAAAKGRLRRPAPLLSLMDTEERQQQQRWKPSSREEERAQLTAEEDGSGGLVAAGALASSAVIAEAIQIGGTAVLLYLGQQWSANRSTYVRRTLRRSAERGEGRRHGRALS